MHESTPTLNGSPAQPGLHPVIPTWAADSGHDAYGWWICLMVASEVQRLRWIPPGHFTMGSPEDEPGRFEGERQHPVRLTRGIWLGDTPVTQALYQAVTGTNPSHFSGAQRPVEKVSWSDGIDFLCRLQQQIPGSFFRLPTEAEWEHACRAGTTTALPTGGTTIQDGRSEELEAIAWYGGNSGGETHPVREKSANPWGLYDMLGNVWEWCLDCYGPYPTGEVVDSIGPTSGTHRVVRGGSWGREARNGRSANRCGGAPSARGNQFGFRIAAHAAI